MPRGVWNQQRERQYQHVLASELARGRKPSVAKRIAAATVNRSRTLAGETKAAGRMRIREDESVAQFGKRVAAQMGYDTGDPTVNWWEFGRAAQYNIGKGRSVPDPARFRTAVEPPPVTHAPQPPPVQQPQAVAMSPAPAARAELPWWSQPGDAWNRPLRQGHRFQKTSGRFRLLRSADRSLRRAGVR